MKIPTSQIIIEAAIPLLARHGYAGTSMRDVADAAGVQPSVIYHYFPDKAALLRAIHEHINALLDAQIHTLPAVLDAPAFLRQRLDFQLRHIEAIVALQQYFMAAKYDFPRQGAGYVPQRAYQHMLDVIERGIAEGVYISPNPNADAKSTTHLVNGFLLEYYPHELSETDRLALIEELATFIERGLTSKAHA